RGIAQQLLERTKTKELVQDVADEVLALGQAERRPFLFTIEHPRNQGAELGFGLYALDLREPIEVEAVEQLLVHPALERLILRVPCVGSCRRNDRRCQYAHRASVQRRLNRPKSPLPLGGSGPRSGRPASCSAKRLNELESSLWLSRASGRPLFNAWRAMR